MRTKRILSIVLTLAMLLGMFPGMSLTASAADSTTEITPSNTSGAMTITLTIAAAQAEELLTTITATGKEQASYSTDGVATVSFSYTAGGSSAYLANWGWWGYGWTATVAPANGYTITKCVFYDDANRTATDSSSPFVVETTEEDKTPRINGTPIDGGNSQSKGLKKIEVYGYATPASSYSVTITPGDNMTKTTGSGDAEQTGLTGAMTDVVYTADNGYYFPTDYSVAEVSGIKVTRDSYTQITVSGTPTADAAIALTAPTAKTDQTAPTGLSATKASSSTATDGKISGVTAAMEYQIDGATTWTAVGENQTEITGLTAGTYKVRYAGTADKNASDAISVEVGVKVAPTVTVPTAKTLTYNGQAQGLVNAGSTEDGTLYYAVTTTNTEPTDESLYTTSIPTATNAGTYKVYYKAVKKDDTYDDSAEGSVNVTISQATSNTVTASIDSWTYGETAKTPTAKATFGADKATFTYSNRKDGPYAAVVPIKPGNYYVKAAVAETANYAGGESEPVAFTIAKATVALNWGDTELTYNGTAQCPTATIKSGVLNKDNEKVAVSVFGAETDVNTGTGSYIATATLTGDAAGNYMIATADKTKTFTIQAKSMMVSANDVEVTYDGSEHQITVQVTEPEGATITYKKAGDTDYSDKNPVFTDAGEYEVSYKVEKANYATYEGKATVKIAKATQAAPTETFTTSKATGSDKADGKISGFDSAKAYQISSDNGSIWTDVEAETTSLDVKAGAYLIRYAGDKNHEAGASVSVTVEKKADQNKPEGLTAENVSEENATDGVVKGVTDDMEYSTDGGETWTAVSANADKIEGLAAGEVLVRYAGTDDKNAGPAATVVVGVASKTEGVVEFKPEEEGTDEEKAITGVDDSTKESVDEFAETQQEEGKDVRVALEITPQKEENVDESSVEETNKVVDEVFAGIDSEKVVTEYLAIDVAKYVDNVKDTENITDTKSPLEIALKFDSRKNNPIVVRTHDGKAKAFGKLQSRPEKKDYKDAMFYIDIENAILYIYSQYFSDFAIVYATETTYNAVLVTGAGDNLSQVVAEGGKVKLPEGLVKDGFTFDGWYQDEAYKTAWTDSDTVTSDITLYAKWNKSVSGVSASPSEVKLTKAGETSQINVTVTPDDAANKKVTYKSGNPKVATVDESGKITAVANGTTTITVTTEDGAKTATVNITVAIPDVQKQGTSEQSKTEQPKPEQPAPVTQTQKEKIEIAMNSGLKISQTGSKITVKWGKVKEADGYEVYVTYCGRKFGKAAKTVKKNTTVSTTITKINGKKINLKKNYKIYVTAYKVVDGKKVRLAKTIMGHVVGKQNTRYSNVKKITLSKSKYSVKVGKTVNVKAKTVLVNKKKKQLSDAHAAEFRYATSNKKIATVDKSGKITGVSAGTCTIYVYARNGYAKTVKVTVE